MRSPRCTLAFTAALLVTPAAAQLPTWVTLPSNSPTVLWADSSIVLVQDNAGFHTYSSLTRAWSHLPPSTTATWYGCDDHVVIVDGNSAWGHATRHGAFERIDLAQAIAKATQRVPGRAFHASFQRARIGGAMVARFEVEVLAEDGFHEVHVDAATGRITRVERHAARRAGTPAAWRVEAHDDAPTGKRVMVCETANVKRTYNLLQRRGRVRPDLSLSTRLQAWTGEEDQGGGVYWHAQDSDNYYIARWNPLENNLRVYTVVDGKRSLPLQSAEIQCDNAAWHRLEVTMAGPHIVIRFVGKIALEADDATLSAAGMVGLWTKAEASTRFDHFRVHPQR